MSVFPDFGAVSASGTLSHVVGALLMYVLLVAVLMVIVCAATWAVASATGNAQTAGHARLGLYVALGAAALAGVGVTWANFLLHLGRQL